MSLEINILDVINPCCKCKKYIEEKCYPHTEDKLPQRLRWIFIEGMDCFDDPLRYRPHIDLE